MHFTVDEKLFIALSTAFSMLCFTCPLRQKHKFPHILDILESGLKRIWILSILHSSEEYILTDDVTGVHEEVRSPP